MRIICLTSILLLSALNAISQNIIDIQNKIDSLVIDENNTYLEKIESVSKQKILVDLQYYKILFENYKYFPNREDRLQMLRIISGIPWYSYREKINSNYARSLYFKSIINLIKEAENDLPELERITVYPVYHADIYPRLKAAIIRAGGKWIKGEIPVRESHGNLIPDSIRHN